MKHSIRALRRRAAAGALLFSAVTFATGCDDDPTRPSGGAPREHGVVLNSTGLSLTVFPVAAPDSTRTIPLGPDGTPGSLAVRGDIALVPLGVFPAVAVVDLAEGVVLRTIPLPAAGGATGVAIVNDSIAFVANPELNSVTPVNYRAGTARAAIDVGVYPQALEAIGDRVFVLEANLVNFTPVGVSTISVIDAGTMEVDADFALGGRNAGDALVSGDSMLYVLHRGDFGEENGSLSVIRLPLAAEAVHHEGFGAGTGTLAELDGDLAISSWAYGLALFDPASASFVVAPEDAIVPEDAVNVLAVGSDAGGRLYVVAAGDCVAPGEVVRLAGGVDAEPDARITTGACPLAIDFTTF